MNTIKHTVKKTFPITSSNGTTLELEIGMIIKNIGEFAVIQMPISHPMQSVQDVLVLECDIEFEGKVDTVAIPLVNLVNEATFKSLEGMLATHPVFKGCANFINIDFINAFKFVGAFKVTALETRELKGFSGDQGVEHEITYTYVVPTLEKI